MKRAENKVMAMIAVLFLYVGILSIPVRAAIEVTNIPAEFFFKTLGLEETVEEVLLFDDESDTEALKISDEILYNFLQMPPDLFLWNSEYFLSNEYTESMRDSLFALAQEITVDCRTDAERIKAVAYWVAWNICYDEDYYVHGTKGIPAVDPYMVIQNKYTICAGYAWTCEYLLQSLGIPCVNVYSPNHAFNIAYDGERWVFFDSTWMSQNEYEYGTYSFGDYIGTYWFDVSYEEGVRTEEDHVIESLPYVVVSGELKKYPIYSSLPDVMIPAGVTRIGKDAFSYCKGLQNVTLPVGVTSIEDSAFQNCTELTSVTVQKGLTQIGNYAFRNCTSLTNMTIPQGLKSIGTGAFTNCSGLTSITIPTGLTSLGVSAFQNCTGLISVTLPTGLSHIDHYTFDGCTNLTGMTIPKGVKSIGFFAFGGCSSLKNVSIPNSVTEIGRSAFNNCSSLERVNISDLSAWCAIQFDDCSSNPLYYAQHLYLNGRELKEISVPSGVTSIGQYAFRNCIGLTKVTIPTSVSTIGGFSFENCSNLVDVTIMPGMTTIGEYAFFNCSSLATVTMPASVSAVGNFAFENCNALSDIYYGGTKEQWGSISKGVNFAKIYVYKTTIHFDYQPLSVTTIMVNKVKTAPGETITWSASSSGGEGSLLYCFYICKDGATIQKGSYRAAKMASYTASEAGVYTVKVFVKDGAGTTASLTGGAVTVSSSGAPTPAPAGLSVTSVTANKTTASPGDTLTWTAAATGGSGTVRYCFYIYKDGATVQKGSYGTAKTISYTVADAGIYSVKVFVKDGTRTTASRTGGTVTIASTAPLAVNSVTVNKTTATPGDTLTWTATANGGSGTIRYCFYIYKDGATVQKGSYGTAKTISYTATNAGAYSVKVFVKDGSGATASRTGGTVTVTSAAPLTIDRITVDPTSADVGDTLTWTVAASGGNGTIRYCFYVYKDGATIQKGSYGAAKTASYTVTESGQYSIKIFVKDGNGTVVSKNGGIVTAAAAEPLTITGISANKTSAGAGDTITWTAFASGGSGVVRYCFYVYKDGAVVKKGSYGAAKAFSYTAAEAGRYSVKVFVKDGSGAAVGKTGGTCVVS